MSREMECEPRRRFKKWKEDEGRTMTWVASWDESLKMSPLTPSWTSSSTLR